MTKPLITMKGVSKSFGANRVLDNLDLDIAAGERLVLIGPSGSGKSTLLRVLMTLEPIDAGTVAVDGVEMWSAGPGGVTLQPRESELRKIRGDFGMIFQQFNLFPHMTVLDNVARAPRSVLGLSAQDAERRATDLIARVGLAEKINFYPRQLSGGQQQRVAIARALAMRPRVMLFDEVTSALDPELVGEVLRVMRELTQEHGLTMIIVTHEMRFARDIADRVCFFHNGCIAESGHPDQVFGNPQHPRTREFLNVVAEG
jgi:polar amino acid transport system ATP-binding protein